MPYKKTKAILFDLGDTLVNFGEVKTFGIFRQGAQLTYAYLKELNQPVGSYFLYSCRSFLTIYTNYFASKITNKDFDSLAVLKKQGRKKGLSLTDSQWQQIAWLWYEPLSKIAKTEIDLAATLKKLTDSGLKLGIVSNTFVNGFCLDRHLEQLGLLEFFPIRIYTCDFVYLKPNPKIFKHAAGKIAEKCKHILFIGDRIDKDVVGSLRSGMTPVLKKAYTNNGKQPPKGTRKIETISQLPALIEQIEAEV